MCLFELLAAGALSAVLVPTFVHLLDAGEDREAEGLASGLLGLALAVMGVVCVLGMLAAPQIARLLSTGVHDPQVEKQQIALSTFFLYWFIPQVLFYVLGTIATAILYAKRHFVITAVAPIANTVFVVASLRSVPRDRGLEPRSRPLARREVDPRGRRIARGRRLRGRAGRRAYALRVQVPSPVRATRRTASADAAPLGLGSPAARRDRDPAPHLDRGGQPRGGWRRRVPVRLRRVHGCVLDPCPAGAHHDPARDVPRREPRRHRRLRESHPVGTGPNGDSGVAGVGGISRALVAGHEGDRTRVRAVPSCSPLRSPRSESACSSTAASSCWRAASTHSATAGRPRSLHSEPRSSARWSWSSV